MVTVTAEGDEEGDAGADEVGRGGEYEGDGVGAEVEAFNDGGEEVVEAVRGVVGAEHEDKGPGAVVAGGKLEAVEDGVGGFGLGDAVAKDAVGSEFVLVWRHEPACC